MTSFNYLVPVRAFRFGFRLGGLAIDNRVRGPLFALTATLVLTASVSVIQLGRLHAAQAAYVRAARQLTAAQEAVRDVDTLRARLAPELRDWETLDAQRRAGLAHMNDLAWIGNRLPDRIWVRALRYENGVYSLDGTAERAADVATALLALRDAGHATVPQLVSLEADGNSAPARIRYRLRIATLH